VRTSRPRPAVLHSPTTEGTRVTILWIILIVVLVLALLGFFGFRR
jgi:hypothetical protein